MHVYSSSDSRTSALGFIAVCAVLLAIGTNLAFTALKVEPAWLFSAPTVAASYGLLYKLVDQYLWKWGPLQRLGIIEVPVIDGTYTGQLVSSYMGRTLPVRIRVDQTWTRIAVRFDVLEPASSTSYSIAAGLGRDGHNDARLTYTYRNQTRPGVAEVDMNDHDGTAELTVDCVTGEMSGRYFNFRGRQGTLMLNRKGEPAPTIPVSRAS
ncbi:hypothetical protein [Catellatospora citrea]|uniref:CD-NTase-associated protein 15 domain-containing protein n=1 Tax=Catellatospora citrea TaxID=53366 RepID=A0A8J3KW51_9ACTN|nr:hypothetical protein [Catellatospora citrea]RKE09081.1 hypothetical protein C8E86_3957 [Catellatospora citrea]GIG03025.1 hypothetical protein Cci01nite_81180 [Catellatospora citrea]